MSTFELSIISALYNFDLTLLRTYNSRFNIKNFNNELPILVIGSVIEDFELNREHFWLYQDKIKTIFRQTFTNKPLTFTPTKLICKRGQLRLIGKLRINKLNQFVAKLNDCSNNVSFKLRLKAHIILSNEQDPIDYCEIIKGYNMPINQLSLVITTKKPHQFNTFLIEQVNFS